jgi:hypothetical protein
MASINSPTDERDTTDPGDDTMLRYRYQHAFGVALLVNSLCGDLDYSAIWCEQREDFLAEVDDSTFDAIQVKTRNEGDGYWKVGDASFRNAIHRFAKLEEDFSQMIRSYNFVSNIAVEHRESQIKHSPKLLLDAARKAGSSADLKDEARTAFDKLAADCPTTIDVLFDVLLKLTFQQGPPKNGYESVLAHSVLPKLDQAKTLGAPALDNLRDEMIAKIGDASSLSGTDGSEFWTALGGNLLGDTKLRRKRISTDAFDDLVSYSIEQPFRYLDSGFAPEFDADASRYLQLKLEDGDVSHQIPQMKSRALAAEARMQELALLNPRGFSDKWNQIVGIVHAECSEAYLNSKTNDGFFGEAMMKELIKRLERIADERPSKVFGESKELLIGTASMLTGECAVGWSKSFPIKEINQQ